LQLSAELEWAYWMKKEIFSVFFAFIVLPQLDGLLLNEKLFFTFCFLNIADQQGLSKIIAEFLKYTACPCKYQSVFGASPTMVTFKIDCCGGACFHCSLLYLFQCMQSEDCKTVQK